MGLDHGRVPRAEDHRQSMDRRDLRTLILAPLPFREPRPVVLGESSPPPVGAEPRWISVLRGLRAPRQVQDDLAERGMVPGHGQDVRAREARVHHCGDHVQQIVRARAQDHASQDLFASGVKEHPPDTEPPSGALRPGAPNPRRRRSWRRRSPRPPGAPTGSRRARRS